MCLSVSEPLIHERGIVTDEKLFATTITPERSHFLETRRFFLARTPLIARPSSIELLRIRSIRIASTVAQRAPAGPREPRSRRTTSNIYHEQPPNKTRADRNRHHNDGAFFVALVNIMVSDFPSPNEAQGARLSSHTQTCERCASRSATLVREHGNGFKQRAPPFKTSRQRHGKPTAHAWT